SSAAIAVHRAARRGGDQLAGRRDAVLQRHVIRIFFWAACARAGWPQADRRPERSPQGLRQAPGCALPRSGLLLRVRRSCGPCAPPSRERWAREGMTSIRFARLWRGGLLADRL